VRARALSSVYKSAFGNVENVERDRIVLLRSGERIEIYDGGTWTSAESLSIAKRGEIAERIKRFRQKRSE